MASLEPQQQPTSSTIGWDIGIKNLAYCILEPTSNSSTETITLNSHHYIIKNWADLNLVAQIDSSLQENSGQVSLINTNLKCTQPKKINEQCGISASYCLENLDSQGNYQGICRNHFKKLGYTRLPDVTVKKCYWHQINLETTPNTTETCTAKPSDVLKNHKYMGYCKKHVSQMIKSGDKTATDFLKINKAKTTSKIDINHLGLGLFQQLDKIKTQILAPSVILLENQPVLKNPTMKSMQMFLYSYYLIRNLDSFGGIQDKHLQCYTASKKLDLIKFLPTTEQSSIDGKLSNIKSGYQKNKKMSILMVEHLLKGNTKWFQFFDKHNKQDDLADSLLMSLHYYEKANLLKLNTVAKKQKEKEAKQNILEASNNKNENTNQNKSSKNKNKKNTINDLLDN